MENAIFITDPVEISTHLENLSQNKTRADLKIYGMDEPIKVILIKSEMDEGCLLLERLLAVSESSARIDQTGNVTVEYMIEGVGYSFESHIMDVEGLNGAIRLQFPSLLIKNQRRQFYRIHPSSPGFCVTVNTERISERCNVIDISGGGLLFLTNIGNDILKPGLEIKGLEFTLPNGYIVKADGIVRYHMPANVHEHGKGYRCGLEFIGMRETIQDIIVRYVFNRQKEELKWRRERA